MRAARGRGDGRRAALPPRPIIAILSFTFFLLLAHCTGAPQRGGTSQLSEGPFAAAAPLDREGVNTDREGVMQTQRPICRIGAQRDCRALWEQQRESHSRPTEADGSPNSAMHRSEQWRGAAGNLLCPTGKHAAPHPNGSAPETQPNTREKHREPLPPGTRRLGEDQLLVGACLLLEIDVFNTLPAVDREGQDGVVLHLHVPEAIVFEQPAVAALVDSQDAVLYPWTSPSTVTLALPGLTHFIGGEQGSVFNATHAFTNARWHRVPDVDTVSAVLTSQGRANAHAAVQEQGPRTNQDASIENATSQDGVSACRSVQIDTGTLIFEAPDSDAALGKPALLFNEHAQGKSRSSILVFQEPIVNLVIMWGESYQHVVLDVLPRLSAFFASLTHARAAGLPASPQGYRYLINAGSPIHAMLTDFFHLDRASIIMARHDRVYTSTAAIVFPTLGAQQKIGVLPEGIFCPIMPMMRAARRAAHQSSQQQQQQQGSGNLILYLRRKPGTFRALDQANEEQLVAALHASFARPDWDVVVWDVNAQHRWDVDEDLFHRARMVIGPHGGAFANILFCDAQAPHPVDIVEFIGKEAVQNGDKSTARRPCYWSLAQALGLRYSMVEPLPGTFDFNGEGIVMHVPKVVETVKSLLATPKHRR